MHAAGINYFLWFEENVLRVSKPDHAPATRPLARTQVAGRQPARARCGAAQRSAFRSVQFVPAAAPAPCLPRRPFSFPID